MKCRTCGSAMVEDHRESGDHATTCWHSCPLCRTKRLTSAPDEPAPALSATPGAGDDDGAYAGDPAPHPGLDLDS